MKKKIRRLQLERETLRNLTPEHLENIAGGFLTDDTRYNSCDAALSRPATVCNSCLPFPSLCC